MPLAELEYDHTVYERTNAGDEKLHVHFFMDVLPDPDASAQAGMRKFRDAEFVSIMVPGDKRNIVVREVRESDIERFPKQYKMFKDGAGEQVLGFPLKEWAGVTRAMVEEFKYLGFHTVEQIAEASDGILSKYPGLREIQVRAKNWLDAQASAAPLERLQAEVESRDKQMAAMQGQIAEMAKALAAAAPKK